jgi:hypothetical protein
MSKCPVCGNEKQDWETLCSFCWSGAIEAHRTKETENSELIGRLKARAKDDLLGMLKELCRRCPSFKTDVECKECRQCIWHEKEKLIRAFIGDD